MPAGQARSRYRWVFDPLDGTTNYAHGLPIFCASLASRSTAARGRRGVRPDAAQELFTAERGRGRLPERPAPGRVGDDDADRRAAGHRVSRTTSTSRAAAIWCDLFGAFLGRARAVRRLGSAALDLCYVAAGRFDGFWEQHLKPWDVAAGALIVEEAGGRVTGMDGSPFDPAAGAPRRVQRPRPRPDARCHPRVPVERARKRTTPGLIAAIAAGFCRCTAVASTLLWTHRAEALMHKLGSYAAGRRARRVAATRAARIRTADAELFARLLHRARRGRARRRTTC